MIIKKLLALSLLLSAATAFADYLGEVRNGHFIKMPSKTSAWKWQVRKPSSVKLVSESNNKCLKLQCMGSGIKLSQKITLIKGKTYYISFRYKFSHITPYVNFYIKFDNNEQQKWQLLPQNIYWNKFTGAFVAQTSQAELLLTVGKPGMQVWLDDVELNESCNALGNGNFENKGKDWKFAVLKGKSRFYISSQAYKGAFAAVQKGEGKSAVYTIAKDIIPGSDYKLTGFSKIIGKANTFVKINFVDVEYPNIKELPVYKFKLNSEKDWSHFSKSFIVPSKAAAIKISLIADNSAESRVLWDKLSLEKISRGE